MLGAPSLGLESRANSRSELREYIKKQHLNFATSPPSLAPVTTLPHRDFPMSRAGQEGRVGGCVCVGGSMKERLSSLIPRQAAREVLTN